MGAGQSCVAEHAWANVLVDVRCCSCAQVCIASVLCQQSRLYALASARAWRKRARSARTRVHVSDKGTSIGIPHATSMQTSLRACRAAQPRKHTLKAESSARAQSRNICCSAAVDIIVSANLLFSITEPSSTSMCVLCRANGTRCFPNKMLPTLC
eukprot:6195591-Pleurochrysis_carterae.AAC.2